MRLFDETDVNVVRSTQAVSINGLEIPEATILEEAQHHSAPTPDAARNAAAQALVVRELLLTRAREIGLQATQNVDEDGRAETLEESLIRATIEAEVIVPSPTRAECKRYYRTHNVRFRSPDIYEAAHILIAADRSDAPAFDAAFEMCAQLLLALKDDPSKFAELAQAHSDCPSAEAGGNLGQLGPGQTVPAFEAALRKMTPGTISTEPVRSPYGVHIIHMVRRIAGKTLPFETVEAQISDYLADAVFHRAVHQYISLLAGRAEISGVEIIAANSPLVQ